MDASNKLSTEKAIAPRLGHPNSGFTAPSTEFGFKSIGREHLVTGTEGFWQPKPGRSRKKESVKGNLLVTYAPILSARQGILFGRAEDSSSKIRPI
jgi:hypothetical protein